MNKGDFILSKLNTCLAADTTFTIVSRFKENQQNVGTTTNVYMYIIKESVTESFEDAHSFTYSVDVGVRCAKTITTTTNGAAWRNDVFARIDTCLLSFSTYSTTYNSQTIDIAGAVLSEAGGYFDDGRTNADCDGIINLTAILK